MQIVIDIPKEIYDALYIDYAFNPPIRNGKTLFYILQKCIANGKSLPEHHGRLIDISEYEKYFNTAITYDDGNHSHVVYTNIIPTIIEADKESESK